VIDTHCHLLPALDDGPDNVTEAIALAQDLVTDGVTAVACTPHFSRAFPTDHDEARRIHDALRDALRRAGIDLELHLGAEIAPTFVVSVELDELRRRSVSGRYLVIEVLPNSPGNVFEVTAARASEAGLTPIFAHPERSRAIQRHPSLVEEARTEGALIQLVAPSLIGRWGRAVATTSWSLLGAGWVDLVGSDAHGAQRRRVHLAEAAELVAVRLGGEVVSTLFEANPARILRPVDAAAP
jgi:protein-tyrosine phosphatase